MNHRVKVWGREVEVEVIQHSKTVWVAVGYVNEERIEVKGRSAGSALGLWRKTAEYRGN